MVFGTLGAAFASNTSRYSQDAYSYKPDWQRAAESATYSSNSSVNSAVRRTQAASALLATSQPTSVTNRFTGETTTAIGLGTSTAILGRLGGKIRSDAQLGERLALQTATRRLRDPVEELLLARNPAYKKQELPPVPNLRQNARDFLSSLKAFQGVGNKTLTNPFPKASARINEEQAFVGETFTDATYNSNIGQYHHLRASIDRNTDFILKDVIDTGAGGTPTHVALKLHGGEGNAYTTQKNPAGRLEVYDAATDTVLRTLNGNQTEIITFAEFQQLRYVDHNENIKEKTDYVNFVALNDVDGNGVFDAADERGPFEELSISINNLSYNETSNAGQWFWKSNYISEASSRFSTAEVNLEGTFVGADALTDYINGDLEIDVKEYGFAENAATLDTAASSGNKLVFKFDYAYDGISLNIKYADNEITTSAVEKVSVALN